ncbi:von Willebrand factor A domain-containing protein 5B2 isoform X1 [Trachemys scripta elegans]|uniref:von Willebrand factor A domain-containing protein 5B2 isoform X1 n=1 Tax=Trachemys scripta elegans TaxID=31138 RepID=UPI001556CA45|nr:von Willebrand factor A domain-containing protein 5B2 isoform X1 [Trachemys scripta elegans]XP_034638240.1 von Willebrand factor A domain-containing protein 5B2 isoform X1 [Trachemys scripta elegans]
MPGLYSLATWTALPLKSSCVKACANGYSLGVTAHLTYINSGEDPVEGVFIYPLEESEVVAGFEAVTGSRSITFQIQNRHRAEDCCVDCSPSLGQPLLCANGHLILDEDLERSTFILSTGPIGPSEILTVVFSSSQELSTLPDGALHITFPSVLTPLVVALPESASEPGGLCDDRLALCPTSCFGATGLRSEQSFIVPPESTDIFRGQAYNPFPYEFSFELLVKGPCLLAGLESPSHALRADANPYANSASTICVTLAEGHQCDRSLEIILYPCEPHCPHLVIEAGAMTYQEYEAHIRSRRDYVRIAKKDSDGERQVAFVQKRFHKDIFHNPVLMLNFCPEVGSVPTDLQTVTREILFLIDQSGSMSGPNIIRIKEALLVAVKSLPSGTLLNIAGFGSHIKPLFPASKPCSNENLRLACEHIQKLRADMHGTNLLAALTWILGQPLHRGYPRQLFIFTDANVSNAGKIIELIRRQASTVRCFSFGLGSGACRRLLRGLAKMSKGRAEFLSPEERLQPKLIKSLKKAIEPAVSDITIDWYVPDTMEALLSPNEIAALYPGDRLISYCTLYNIASFRDKKTGRERVCRSLSRGSVGSAFQSQDEACSPDVAHPYPAGESQDISQALQEISREISLEFSAGGVEESEKSVDPVSDIWKRIYQASYIQEQYVLTHCSISTDRSQGLLSHGSTSSESTGSRDIAPESCSLACTLESNSQQGQKSVSVCDSSTKSAPFPQAGLTAGTKACVALSSEELARRKKALARAALSGRSFSSPHGELDAHRLRRALEKVSQKRNQSLEGKLDEIGPELQRLRRSLADSSNLLSPSHLDWDMLVEPPYLFSASPAAERGECEGGACLPLRCQVVIHALSAGKPVSWEVTAILEPLLQARDGEGKEELPQESCKAWDKLLHHLTASSVIRDHENVAQREAEVEHSFSRRLRLKAIQSSKACNTPSIYTCLVPVDSSTQEALPRALEVRNAGGPSSHPRGSQAGIRRQRSHSVGLGRRRDSEELDDAVISAERDETPASPISVSSAAGVWEKQSCPDGPVASPSATSMGSQKSMENFAGSRFSLSRIRGHGLALRPQCLTPASELSKDSAIHDYLPLVRLQQALGTFQLTESFSEVVQIPLDRLRRASPYASHRASLSPGSCTSPWALVAKGSPDGGPKQVASQPSPEGVEPARGSQEGAPEPGSPHSHSTCSEVLSTTIWPQADSGRGSETDACDHSPVTSEAVSLQEVGLEADEGDLESASWATAVALAWLEHRCAGFFVEWELLAAKADAWLRAQQLPEGVDVGSLKGAARHLFLLLRHWDENIKLNMLCYNPSNM